MSNCTALRFTALGVLALGLASLVACSSSDRDNSGGTIRKKDAGTTAEVDGGVVTLDSGTSSNNCNNPTCAPNQLMGPAPDCMCLAACSGGLTYNPTSRQCESTTSTPDAGTTTRPDAGQQQSPDAGSTEQNCTSAADCMGATPACVTADQNTGSIVTCAGQTDCFCINTCAFDNPGAGCPSGQRCTWLGPDSNVAGKGACISASGGGTQGSACQAMFTTDANGDPVYQSDNCEVGFTCKDAQDSSPTGTCVQLCNPQNGNGRCGALGNYVCDNFGDPSSTFGLCLSPVPANVTDVGEACTSASTCTGGVCDMFFGACTYDCSGTNGCPSDTFCVGFLPQVPFQCLRDCTQGGSSVCSGIDPNTACHHVGTTGICLPRCTSDNDCRFQGQTCNTSSGECNG